MFVGRSPEPYGVVDRHMFVGLKRLKLLGPAGGINNPYGGVPGVPRPMIDDFSEGKHELFGEYTTDG